MAKTQAQILIDLTEELPGFASNFLIARAGERTVSTRIGYTRDFKAFLEYLIKFHPDFKEKNIKYITSKDLENLSPLDIDKYLTYYADTHSVPATARAKVSIAAFFKYLKDTLCEIKSNPVSGSGKIKVPQKDYVIYLSIEEQTTLLQTIRYGTGLTDGQLRYHDKLKSRDLAMLFLFLDTGLRVSELAALDIGDIDFETCSAFITRKRGKLSQIYFSDEAAAYLREYMDERKQLSPVTYEITEPLFTSLKGERLGVREIEKIVPKYVKAALPGKIGISPHKLRSSFAMGYYAVTKDILTLQDKLGHTSLNTTNIYAKASKEQIIKTRNWRTMDT